MAVVGPMPAEDLLFLVDLIDPALDGWRLKRRIVECIGAVPGGDWFGALEVAALVGMSLPWCRSVLVGLECDRVIIREVSGRKIWREVNIDWEEWRVPWTKELDTIRQELADLHERRQMGTVARFARFLGGGH